MNIHLASLYQKLSLWRCLAIYMLSMQYFYCWEQHLIRHVTDSIQGLQLVVTY
jgi:hypothetical protein